MQEENTPGASASVPGNQTSTEVAAGTPPKTNTLAVLSLVFSFFFQLVGLILGIIALKQIKEKGEEGRGLAIAGIIISIVGMVFTLILLTLIIIGGVAANTELNDNAANSDSSIFDGEAETVESRLGRAFELDGTTVTVTNLRDYNSDSQYYQPEPGNKFINVDVEVKNNTTKDIALTDYGMYVIDVGGNQYDSSFDAVDLDAKTLSGTLTAGNKVTGIVGFEVPAGAEIVKLHLKSFDFSSQNKAIVNL